MKTLIERELKTNRIEYEFERITYEEYEIRKDLLEEILEEIDDYE